MMDFENVQIQLIDTPPLSEEYIEPTLFDLLRRADLIMLVVDIQSAPAEQLELSLDLLKAHWIVPTQLRETVTDRRFVPKPFLLVGTKHDSAADDELLEIVEMLLDARWLPLLTVSAETGHHLDDLRRAVYDKLGIMRIYSKPPLADADLTSPFVLPKESTVETFAAKVHRDFYDNLKSARVWGSGAFDGQMVSRDYVLADGDVVELRT
jgi:ribosome-interacting GTPase 1